MPRSALLGMLATALALGAAGCGGGRATTVTTGSTSAPETLFVRNCASCHRLAAADASGSVGADLDRVRPSKFAVLKAIAEGPGDMPSALLQGADAQKVARYVAHVAGQRR